MHTDDSQTSNSLADIENRLPHIAQAWHYQQFMGFVWAHSRLLSAELKDQVMGGATRGFSDYTV